MAEELLKLNQKVVGHNLEHIKNSILDSQWDNFIEGDITCIENVSGFLNMLQKIMEFLLLYMEILKNYQKLKKFAYAVTKYVNELYMGVFYKCYGFESIGLRYLEKDKIQMGHMPL